VKKFRGFFTAFFLPNFLEIPVLGLKKSLSGSHPKPTDTSGFFVFSVFYIIKIITFTATNCDILSDMKIEIKLITKRKETFEGFPLVIKISHQNKRKSKTVSFCFE
jgi:hypothetical protein